MAIASPAISSACAELSRALKLLGSVQSLNQGDKLEIERLVELASSRLQQWIR
jgi:hypothetical protein